MATLTDPIRRFIVVSIARRERPTAVAEAVKEHFGVEVDRSQVAHYDPTGVKGREVAKKWRAIFDEERERFDRDIDAVALSQRAARMRELQRLFDRLAEVTNPNPKLLLELIVEAEKIMGDLYTNRHKVTHDGRVDHGVLVSPAPIAAEEWSGLAAAQQRELAKHRGNGAGGNGKGPAQPAKGNGKRFTLNGDAG